MKSNKIILALLILSMITLIFSGCGGSVTPPIPDNTDNIDSEEIEPIEVASGEINLDEGGVIEVTDPNSELYGLKLTIEPLKNIRENKENPIFTIIKFFLSPDVASCKLPDYQGFLITPFAIKSDFTNVLFGKLEIPYYVEQLINVGVAINSNVKLCRVPTQSCSWEEVSQDKYIVENNVVNIPIGTGDLGYSYTLTVNNTAIPHPSKNPQPGDLLYKSSKWGTNEGWLPGHVGIYVGERYDEKDGKYNVIEAQLPVVKRSYYDSISAFSHDCIYIGAREPESGLSHQKRNLIIAFAEGVVGTEYATIETVSSMFWTGLGRGELVKGDNGRFNCVGLAEKAYQLVGIDLVSNYDEGNVIHGPYHILTPAEQWYKTVSASGVLVQNISPKISSLEITPESPIGVNSSVSITCIASDQDGDILTYIWDKNGGTFEGSTSELPITKGKSIIWVTPNKEGTYTISCKVIDNYGGEDSESKDILVGGSTANHSPDITSTAITSATKGQPYSYDVNATDSDGDIPVYSLTTKPSGMSINSSTGLITWTPTVSGNYNVTVKVFDGELFDTQSFTVKVEENGTTNQPPTLTLVGSGGVSPGSGTPSTTFAYSVYYSDPEGASPTVKNVYIDGSSHTMSGSGSGSTYTYQISGLSAGTHTYSFQFSDGTYTVNLPNSGTYSAPTVTSTVNQNVTLTLYIYENSTSGPPLSGVSIGIVDGGGNSFGQTTNSSGYVTITGTLGTWHFSAMKSGYDTNNWSQSITTNCTKYGYIVKSATPVGAIDVFATLDGSYWIGSLSYSLTGPSSSSGSTVSAVLSNKPVGSYSIAFNSGGPSNASLSSITPSSTQTLSEGGVIAFTLNFTGSTLLPGPTSLSPGTTSAPGPTISTLTPTLQWQAVSNADYYNLSVSIYPYGTSNIIYYNQQVYGNSITLPSGELEAGNKYRWNMRAHNSAGYSEYSLDYYFQTGTTLVQVQLSGPSNGATLPPMSVVFWWNPVSNATKYQFILYNQQGQVALDTTNSSTSTFVALGTEETITLESKSR